MHDFDLRNMALRINDNFNFVNDFKASTTWITKFKRKYGICSRRVTTFVTKQHCKNSDALKAAADKFVTDTKQEMSSVPLDIVCNCDQSGFVKELHCPRSLAPIGVKRVQRVIQSGSAISHSYTIFPALFADGHLGEKLYVQLQEPNGQFPKSGHFLAQNLYVTAGRSHIMTKAHLLDWVTNCLFEPGSTKSIFLVVDSWTSFKDHSSMLQSVPPGSSLQIRNIPPGTTSMVQPLDLFFFRPFKQIMKRCTAHVMAHNIPFVLSKRDNILKLISLIYRQFCAGSIRALVQKL